MAMHLECAALDAVPDSSWLCPTHARQVSSRQRKPSVAGLRMLADPLPAAGKDGGFLPDMRQMLMCEGADWAGRTPATAARLPRPQQWLSPARNDSRLANASAPVRHNA